MIPLLWRENDVAVSFWRHNDVVIVSYVPWDMFIAYDAHTTTMFFGHWLVCVTVADDLVPIGARASLNAMMT